MISTIAHCQVSSTGSAMSLTPERIVCLSAEAADWFCRIGAWERVVGVTAFFTVPPGCAPKPCVGGFSTTHFEEIGRLKPDLIITFSDVQASLVNELVRRGFAVLATNQRTLAEIEATLALLARVVDAEAEGKRWLAEFQRRLAPVEKVKSRPRVYFEEWNDPLVAGIAWVSELIERAGGRDLFAELRTKGSASERVVLPEQVCEREPEIILASWCGRPVRIGEIKGRPGWNKLAAVRHEYIYEIASGDILQPGFRLVEGYERMKQLIKEVATAQP
jgi:iron complex transport system substrate-binding protein